MLKLFFLNSELFALEIPQTFLANSITAHCNPRHIPKKGIFFSLAYLTAFILPSIPLSPKPPGTRIPETPLRSLSGESNSYCSALIVLTITLVLFSAPAWIKASIMLYMRRDVRHIFRQVQSQPKMRDS